MKYRAIREHSDRFRILYASHDYQQRLAGAGIRCSMSRKGNRSRKNSSTISATPREKPRHRTSLNGSEVFYDRQRRPTTLGYHSPVEFEAIHEGCLSRCPNGEIHQRNRYRKRIDRQ